MYHQRQDVKQCLPLLPLLAILVLVTSACAGPPGPAQPAGAASQTAATAVQNGRDPDYINEMACTDPARFKPVITVFNKMIADGLHEGAQLAIYENGELSLYISGGKDIKSGKPITGDNLFCVRSTTKGLTALVIAMLYERGLLKYDEPVAKYWPEFARNGKENITIAQIMGHRAGIPQSISVPVTKWTDRAEVARGVEELKPVWMPGKYDGYHASTYGWVADELAMRIADNNIAGLLARDVTGPLGIKDVYIGLPAGELNRFCPLALMGETDKTRAAFNDFMNTYDGMKLPLCWVSGAATARDLARLFNIFAFNGSYGGRTIISKETQELISRPTNSPGEMDLILKWPVRWGLGLINGDTPSVYGSGQHSNAIGHAGGGANVAWADPDRKMSVAFLCNGMRTGGEEWERYRILADSIYGVVLK
jgi:CubicO group peptidase (beta-lactamase class C family)